MGLTQRQVVHGSGLEQLQSDCQKGFVQLEALNELLEKLPFKMERLRDFVKQLCADDTLWSIDLLSAYSHAEVNERFRTLIGFNFEGTDCVYNCLPFGLRTSAYAFAKLTAVTAEVLRRAGSRQP